MACVAHLGRMALQGQGPADRCEAQEAHPCLADHHLTPILDHIREWDQDQEALGGQEDPGGREVQGDLVDREDPGVRVQVQGDQALEVQVLEAQVRLDQAWAL